jgi:mono/diheme cytochrome c family protein
MNPAVLVTLALVTSTGCEGVLPAPDLERMIDQPSYRPFERSQLFADGRAMRPPPAGVIARGEPVGQTALATGISPAGQYVDDWPLPLTRSLLDRGRDRFDLFCATCHGVRGDGQSAVAQAMTLRRPPSLVAPPVTGFPPGRLFQVASTGYGLMPAYQSQLTVEDRWAVVAYLHALQLSQDVGLDELPADLRARAMEALR